MDKIQRIIDGDRQWMECVSCGATKDLDEKPQQGYTIKGARKAIEEFAKTASNAPTNNTEAAQPAWYQSVPSANSNDNKEDVPAAPTAEVAAPESAPAESPKVHVDAMRDELVQMRESLKKLLPNQL